MSSSSEALHEYDLTSIVELELNKVFKRLIEHGLKLEVTDAAKEFLIEKGYNPEFGARPLRRAIEHYLEDPISEALLRGQFKDKNVIKIDVLDEDHMKFEGYGSTGRESRIRLLLLHVRKAHKA